MVQKFFPYVPLGGGLLERLKPQRAQTLQQLKDEEMAPTHPPLSVKVWALCFLSLQTPHAARPCHRLADGASPATRQARGQPLPCSLAGLLLHRLDGDGDVPRLKDGFQHPGPTQAASRQACWRTFCFCQPRFLQPSLPGGLSNAESAPFQVCCPRPAASVLPVPSVGAGRQPGQTLGLRGEQPP